MGLVHRALVGALLLVASVSVVACASPARAADGPWVSAYLTTSSGRIHVLAKYTARTDTFSICADGPSGGLVRWHTATSAGRNYRSTYLGAGCTDYKHRFMKGTRVTYRVCAVIREHNPVWWGTCSRRVSGFSTT